MRLFVSVDLDGLAGAIRSVQELLSGASGLRLTDPDGAHVTLKFLGETDPQRLPALAEQLERAVEESGVESFDTEFGGVGVFPSLESISVVWVGVRAGTDQFTRLHEAIERRTTAVGFDPEDHEFTPHVTVARMDHAGGKELVQSVVENRDPTVGEMSVSTVSLTESELGQSGPEYSTVAAFELGG